MNLMYQGTTHQAVNLLYTSYVRQMFRQFRLFTSYIILYTQSRQLQFLILIQLIRLAQIESKL